MTSTGICGTPFTIKWVLEQIADKTGVFNPKLIDFEETRIGVGQGYLSVVVRLNLNWAVGADTSLPNIVVLKVPTLATIGDALGSMMSEADMEAQKQMQDDMEVFVPLAHNNECALYEIMSKVVTPPLLLPLIYGWRRMQSCAAPGAILMEDFSARNAAIVNKAEGLTLKQAENLTDALASLYAWSIESDQSFRMAFTVDNDMLDNWGASMTPMFDKLIKTYPDTFTKDDIMDWAMSGAYTRLCFGVADMTKTEAALHMPLGVVHGDMWTNNILFKRPDGSTDDITDDIFAVIDWQTAHAGNCMEDMARMLVSSCPPDMRRAHKDMLITRFYDKCASKLSKPPSFTVKDLLSAYDVVLPFATIFYIVSVGIMMDNPMITGEAGSGQCVRRQQRLLERARAALDDCQAVKAHMMSVVDYITK